MGPEPPLAASTILEQLQRAPLMANVDARSLATLASRAGLLLFAPGQTMLQSGEPGDRVYLITRGYAKTVRRLEGRETLLEITGPGEVLGDVGLVDREPSGNTVVALEPTELLVLPTDALLAVLPNNPQIATTLLRTLARRMSLLVERSDGVAFLNVEERLARRLLRLAETYGEIGERGVRLPFRLTQQEIGNLVDATRESANKLMRAWELEGVLFQEDGHFVIRDLERLAQRASSDPAVAQSPDGAADQA